MKIAKRHVAALVINNAATAPRERNLPISSAVIVETATESGILQKIRSMIDRF